MKKTWKRIWLRLTGPDYREMEKAINEIGCNQSKYIRTAIKYLGKQSNQIEIMRDMG